MVLSDEGNDLIFSAGKANYILSGSDDDTIISAGQMNNVLAGSGNDIVLAMGISNNILAQEGNDIVIGLGQSNIISGGAGEDILVAAGSSNIFLGGESNDTTFGIGMNNTVFGGSGNDWMLAGGTSNYFIDTEGEDTVVSIGTGHKIYTFGESYSDERDTVVSFGVLNKIYTGDGNDILTITDIRTTIDAGDGDDSIDAGGFFNNFDAGNGNDSIDAGGGDDTYILGNEEFTAYIDNQGDNSTEDVLEFGTTFDTSNITFTQSGDSDLEISVLDTNQTIILQNWYTDESQRVDTFEFSHSVSLQQNQIQEFVEILSADNTQNIADSDFTLLNQVNQEYTSATFYIWGEDSTFDKTKSTYVITHGWQSGISKSDNWVELAKAIEGSDSDQDANIIFTDWSDLAGNYNYMESANNMAVVGKELGTFLDSLQIESNADIMLIGHSLGAHLSGIAADTYDSLTGHAIDTVIGLDPAGPLFEYGFKDESERLDATDANHVVALHSSNTLGYDAPLADLDVYLNWDDMFQPGQSSFIGNHSYPVELLSKLYQGFSYQQDDGLAFGLDDLLNVSYLGEQDITTTVILPPL